jgi:hypothetical protein
VTLIKHMAVQIGSESKTDPWRIAEAGDARLPAHDPAGHAVSKASAKNLHGYPTSSNYTRSSERQWQQRPTLTKVKNTPDEEWRTYYFPSRETS